MKTDEQIREDIRQVLIECRKEKGVTQEELARIVGKTPTAVASWEQGLSLPNVQTLYRLATYYKKTLEYMFGDKDENEDHDNETTT